MARRKEFDQDEAIQRAIRVFSQQGFGATSTEDLMQAMEIGRQSMYDTFGDKRTLFLTALKAYVSYSCGAILQELQQEGEPLVVLRNALVAFAERKDMASPDGCMGLNALSEFGTRDEEVTATIRQSASAQKDAVLKLLRAAVAQGTLAQDRVAPAADFFDGTLAAIRYAAKAGKSRKALREMAVFAGSALA
jgi:AcrR family transcriptional regulator